MMGYTNYGGFDSWGLGGMGFGFGLVVIFLLWSIYWKGMALWKSARTNEPYWFIAFLFINTAGILEIAYLYYFSKQEVEMDEIRVEDKKK